MAHYINSCWGKAMEIAERVKEVGIWIRVSTEDQARGDSPEHHEKRARLYAESKGWHVKEVYHLEAVSGKSVMGRPETQQMLEDIKTGYISGLIFSKLARLARNTKELLEFSDIFNQYDADLISLQEAIDTSTPAGRLFYTMIAAMAQWEREEIASRVAASVPIRAKLGKPLGGVCIFGYRWENKVLVPDPIEAPIRKLIFELFLEHRRKKTVARVLNDAGYRTRNGSLFSDTSVSRLLRDSTAKGIRLSNYTKKTPGGGGRRAMIKPKEDWVYTQCEPIVSEELWTECNEILDRQEREHRRPSKKAVYLFSGLIYCECGKKMYVPSNTDKYTCRACRNKIGLEDMEEVFQGQLRHFLFSPDEIGVYLSQADQIIKEKEELLQSLLAEEQKVKQEMESVYRLYIDKEISSQGFGQRYKPLEERANQIGDQIPEVQAGIDFLKIQYLSTDQILQDVKYLCSRWSELDAGEKRQIVENITEKVIIGKDEVTINLSYLPPTSELMAKRQRTN